MRKSLPCKEQIWENVAGRGSRKFKSKQGVKTRNYGGKSTDRYYETVMLKKRVPGIDRDSP